MHNNIFVLLYGCLLYVSYGLYLFSVMRSVVCCCRMFFIFLFCFATVGGLIVAVILQIFYNYILSQVESLTIEMEDASISLMDVLVKYQENK